MVLFWLEKCSFLFRKSHFFPLALHVCQQVIWLFFKVWSPLWSNYDTQRLPFISCLFPVPIPGSNGRMWHTTPRNHLPTRSYQRAPRSCFIFLGSWVFAYSPLSFITENWSIWIIFNMYPPSTSMNYFERDPLIIRMITIPIPTMSAHFWSRNTLTWKFFKSHDDSPRVDNIYYK